MGAKASAAGKKSHQSNTSAGVAKAPVFRSESVILACALLLATLAVYLPVVHHPFVNFDDPVYVVDNVHIASGLDWDTITWAFTTFYQFNWHPLTWMSHAFDVQLYGMNAGGHHATNLLLQAANALLLFWVLRSATGYVGRSAMVAGLFALHPVNVESVAWVAERKNVLSMFFFLLGLAAYHWYVEATDGKRGQGRVSVGRYLVMSLCFVLGLMAKPQIVTFPFLLLLWDYWPLRRMATGPGQARSFGWLVKEKIPLFAICAASSVVTVEAQKAGGAVASLSVYPFSIRLTNAIVAYCLYIGKAIWPARLAPMYPHPWHPLPMLQVIPSLALLIAITALVIKARSRRYLLMGWLWFLGALVPMIGLVHVGNQAMADRYAYLPYIGLFVMVCWGVADFAEARKIPVNVLRVAGLVVLVAVAIVSRRQVGYWSDNVTLWTHTLAVTHDNYIAHDNLAQYLMREGEPEEAMQQYRDALAIYPDDPSSNFAIAADAHRHGDLPGAVAHYEHMVRITPPGAGRAELYAKLGLVYLDERDLDAAKNCFHNSVTMDTHNVEGWLGLGLVADREGQLNVAIKNYEQANAVKPLRITYLLLARALERNGQPEQAQAARQRGNLLGPEEKTTQTFSGGILGQ